MLRIGGFFTFYIGGFVEQPGQGTVTRAVNALGVMGSSASNEVISRVYEELRRLAASQLRGNGDRRELEPAVLVNEVFARVMRRGNHWMNREHFYATAAQAMRHYLVDEARRRNAVKRGGGRVVPLPPGEGSISTALDPTDLIQLDIALHDLARYDGRLSEVVMLRYFAGRTVEDTANLLGISERTVKRDWDFARAWLYKKMSGENRTNGEIRC